MTQRPKDPTTRSRKSLKARLIPGCLWLLIVLLVPTAFILTPPPAPPPMDPIRQEQSKAHIEEIKHEIAEVTKAAKQHLSYPFELRITADDMNTFLETDSHALKILADKQVEQAYVRIRDGRVEVTATRRRGGVPVTITAILSPVLKDNRTLGFEIVGIALGRIGLPEAAARRAGADLADALTRQAVDPALKYKSVRVEGDSVVVSGDTR